MAVLEAGSEVCGYIWGEWIPSTLIGGTLRCKPEPCVVGTGLEHVQTACDRLRDGVSAMKLVVELA